MRMNIYLLIYLFTNLAIYCVKIISPKLTNDRTISIEQGRGSSANSRYSLEQNERKHYNAESVWAFSRLRAEPGPPKYEAGKPLNQPRSLVGGGKKQVKGTET